MKTALMIYIAMGVLSIVRLILFNIRKIWVRRPPDPIQFKASRFCVILVLCIGIGTFLYAGYQATIHNRYEIATERFAQQHAQFLLGQTSREEFRAFVEENGTDQVLSSFDETMNGTGELEIEAGVQPLSVKFMLSSWCTPRYWEGAEGFEQVEILDSENPVYVMYVLDDGVSQEYYVLRMVNTDQGWKYDWFGPANEQHRQKIDMPTLLNGKWYTVKA